MTYRVTFAPPTDDTLAKMRDRDAFKAEVERKLGNDPYGHDSEALDGQRDRRQAVIAGAILRYYVSQSVLTVTVVRLIRFP